MAENIISLEKSMFFLPNRLHVTNNEIYVSFNIAPIPADMKVLKMTLKVPLTPSSNSFPVHVYEIRRGWDEQSVSKGQKPSKKLISTSNILSQQAELSINLTRFGQEWTLNSTKNHGIAILIPQTSKLSNKETLPFLIVETI